MSATLTADVTHYKLTPKALEDLDDIWRYTASTWSLDQADRYVDELVRIFHMLVTMPRVARERTEFQPPVRIHLHAEHLVVYSIEQNMILVIRILGGRQNWKAILENADS